MARQEMTPEEIVREVREKRYRPVYYLMGEEPYYIDRIAAYIADTVLTEEEKAFNLLTVYGGETDMASVVTAARKYPMMSEHQVIIVREAQHLKSTDELCHYLQKPLSSTLLVFCHKNGVLDRRKKAASLIEKVGILYESKKVKEAQLPAFIGNYLQRKGLAIESKAAGMMAEFVGTDLCRLAGELDKLAVSLPQGERCITPSLVERNVGISKDYNNFELKNALIEKDILKANRIVKYFEENPRNNPVQVTLSLLFNFFSNLMLAYYAPSRTEQGVAAQLGLRSTWQAREYLTAMQRYSGIKVMKIIGAIRTSDARSKGVENSSLSGGEILRELVYEILH